MLTLAPSVKIYVAARPVDARKSFDGLAAMVEAEFGLEPLSGHVFVFINRRAHIAQLLFWERSGFCIVKKRLEAGSFHLARRTDGTVSHIEIDSAELALTRVSSFQAARRARQAGSRSVFPARASD